MRTALIPPTLLLLGALCGCSYHPDRKQSITEGDFLEPVVSGEQREVWKEIAELKERADLDFQNAELHRDLAVLYRLAGTPRARLLSSEEIDRAIGLAPLNPLYRVEKGLTLLAQRFVGDAEQCFLDAVKMDPRCFEAWFQLGRMEQYEYLKTMCFPDHLKNAIEYFGKAYRLDRKHEATLVSLGFLHGLRQMHQTGLRYATRAVLYHPESTTGHLLCGMLYTRLKEFDKAQKEFASAFLLMTERDLKAYENIAPLLPPGERELYESSMPQKRKDWNRRFWAENDPTPSTEMNERHLEHFSRVFIADYALSDERRDSRGADTDRGGALVKFGFPDKKLYDLGTGTSGAWIVWQYDSPNGPPFNLYYWDEFLNGDYHFPITDAYGEMSLKALTMIPQRYEFPITYASFPMSVDLAALRGSEERTRLEFAIAVPDSLRKSKSASWDLFVTFFDSEWNRFSRDRITVRPDSLEVIEKLAGRFLVYSFAIEMLPRALDCTCTLELLLDKELRRASRSVPLAIPDLFGRSLKVSGIKLTIPEGSGSCSNVLDPIPAYPEKGFLCLSYEVYNLKLDADNQSRYRLTYAIRNPNTEGDQSSASLRKTLAYMWSDISGKKPNERPYVESSIEQRAQTSTVSDRIQIDIGALEPGTYLLLLQVEDLVALTQSIEGKQFTVNDRKER